jgi:hypothetical protein
MESEGQSEPSVTPLPKRRWFQYSISTLLLLIVVCAVVLALVVNPARRQRRAFEFFRNAGGIVRYADEGNIQFRHGPEWLRHTLGRDYFSSIISISLGGTRISDKGLAHLQGLTALEFLYLTKTQVSDEGLSRLKGLTALRVLELDNTQISDAGLAHLRGLTTLDYLSLKGTQVTEEGVVELQQALPNCVIEY